MGGCDLSIGDSVVCRPVRLLRVLPSLLNFALAGPRYIWTDIPEELAELAGLTELLEDPDRAKVSGGSCQLKQRLGLIVDA